MFAKDDPGLIDWFAHKTDKYVSGGRQNRILEVMTQQVLTKVELYLHNAPFHTIMVEETTDISNCEQVIICICWVNNFFEVRKELIILQMTGKN